MHIYHQGVLYETKNFPDNWKIYGTELYLTQNRVISIHKLFPGTYSFEEEYFPAKATEIQRSLKVQWF